MSFITKRERVFHEVDLYDLPARNEGKLKAYASCTDARAWSHFGSSKAEHLTELIKRNNDLPAAKYVPTTVIVDTLMVSKNLEIGRLKRKIEEFEQMLAVYEELDLDCAQKCEIAKAHAAIKAANKDLDELCLNLDTSTFTDGFDTESFETGKSRSVQYSANVSIKSRGAESDRSRGDAWTVMSHDKDVKSQANQTPLSCPCDASVSVHDPRIDEMRDQIISKDAKLNAMHNSMAIMENDICEPFSIYAHIYTALEKIYGILSQNTKYKQYLNLMTAGKDIRCIDIKGKILFKMKVLEKFCLALIAPCSKDFSCTNAKDCCCYRTDVSSSIELTYRITPAECASSESTKRSQLVADIMEHEEMKEILSKESTPDKMDEFEIDKVLDTACTINEENQKRIKDLQECYEDLLNCYENLKHETDCIRVKCAKYEELELELERLRGQLKEYNSLWSEKEHYRKRSEDLDNLKQQYMVLAEESSDLETKLKAEFEINRIKADAIEELRTQNMSLERRLNEMYISFEKEKNDLQCQLQESECKCMCQEQQIKSLSTQIVKLLEQEPENIPRDDTADNDAHTLYLTEENETLKQQLRHYQEIEHDFHNKMSLVNELEAQISQWRATYEEAAKHNKYLEDCIYTERDERERLTNENKELLDMIKDKTAAVENLMDVIKTKSIEINKLSDENQNFSSQLEILGEQYENQVNLSRQESQELLRKVKDYDDFVQKQEDLSNVIDEKMQEYESLKKLLKQKLEENQKLKSDLSLLQNEDIQNKKSIEIAKKESLIMEHKLSELEHISQQFTNLKDAFDRLSAEKIGIENDLKKKASQLESAIYSVKLNKKESGELLRHSESIKNELAKLTLDNQIYASTNDSLQKQLDLLREENQALKNKSSRLSLLEKELLGLKQNITDILKEKTELEYALQIKNQEVNNLCDNLDSKIEENLSLNAELTALQSRHLEASKNLKSLENENELNQMALNICKKESSDLMKKLENENQELKTDYETVKLEKERLQRELETYLTGLKKIKQEKKELESKTDDLLAHNNDLEKTLISTRDELLKVQSSPEEKSPVANLVEEIQNLRDEKVAGQNKIRELLHRLDESEQVIANFQDEVNSRDYRISVMQNQINNLGDEVQRLQNLLEDAINAGTDIKNTNQSIEQARKQIEAHHSKASHNMKLELAALQNTKSKLEDQLSITKSQNELSSKDVQKYLSEIHDLKSEREVIVADINQLEIYSVGDSELTPYNCEIDRILNSLHRIKNAFEGKNARSINLEQTLAKVKASSQSFLIKADEAKTYFEIEKQKILNEKNEALKEKLNVEKQLTKMKNELDRQLSHDGGVIKDLEAEILNQKLIINKINVSTKTYVKKLEDEMKSLQDLYQNSISKICELEEKLKSNAAKTDSKEDMIQKLITDLENKSKEVAELQSTLSDKNPRKLTSKGVQILSSNHYKDMYSQTEDAQLHTFFDQTESGKSTVKVRDINNPKTNKSQHRDYIKPGYEYLPQLKSPSVNEVQILAAELEPTFDFVKSSYLNYKIKRLSPGILEHHSIPSSSIGGKHLNIEEIHVMTTTDSDPCRLQNSKTVFSNEILVDIYNSPSVEVNNQSKIIEIDTPFKGPANNVKMSDFTAPEIKSNFILANNEKPTTNQYNSQRLPSDTNIFVIFKDKDDNLEGKSPTQNNIHSDQQHLMIGNRTATFTSKTHERKMVENERKRPKSAAKINTTSEPLHTQEKEADKIKQKLSINLPRVGVDSQSFATTADCDDNSLDSYTLDIYSHRVKETLSDTTAMRNQSSGEDIAKLGTPSLPTISNVDDIYLESRSFLDLPSKASSFTKVRVNSEIKSYDKSDDSKDHFFIDDEGTVRVRTKPQKIFSLVEKLERSGGGVNDSQFNFIASDKKRTRNRKTTQHDFIESRLNKFNDNIDKTLVDGITTKMLPQNAGVYNTSDGHSIHLLIPEDKSKFKASRIPHEKLSQQSYDSIQKVGNVVDKKGKNTSTEPILNRSRNEGYGKTYDHVGVTSEKSQTKTNSLTLSNVTQGSENEFDYIEKLINDGKNKTKSNKNTPNHITHDMYNDSDGSRSHFITEEKNADKVSHHDLGRVGADVFSKVFKSNTNLHDADGQDKKSDFALRYILDSVKTDPGNYPSNNLITIYSDDKYDDAKIQPWIALTKINNSSEVDKNVPKYVDQSVMVKFDTSSNYYEDVIHTLRKSLEDVEKDHKKQIEAIKIRYDRNIQSIINEHNQGVKNIQNLHEDTMQDIMRVHENEVESLRSMSLDAMRKAEKLEKECMALKSKISIDNSSLLDEVPTRCVGSFETKSRKKLPSDMKVLTKTTIEAFNVKPKQRLHGPCTCSLDINISDTIRNIFEQVDVEQRKMAEATYLKYIATKISNGHIETLDTQELSFLHLKVCRTWKLKLNKEEALQKKIESLEVELINKQKSAQQHMAELDRKVAQEKRRLEEVREAVCRSAPTNIPEEPIALPMRATADNNRSCNCTIVHHELMERRSAGDLVTPVIPATTGVVRPKKIRTENRGVSRTDAEERRDRRMYSDEPPTRLRRHDRPSSRGKK